MSQGLRTDYKGINKLQTKGQNIRRKTSKKKLPWEAETGWVIINVCRPRRYWVWVWGLEYIAERPPLVTHQPFIHVSLNVNHIYLLHFLGPLNTKLLLLLLLFGRANTALRALSQSAATRRRSGTRRTLHLHSLAWDTICVLMRYVLFRMFPLLSMLMTGATEISDDRSIDHEVYSPCWHRSCRLWVLSALKFLFIAVCG